MWDLESLDRRILEAVEDHWRENKTPLTLASLGTKGEPQIAHLMESHGISLLKYVETRLGQKIQLIQNPDNPLVHSLAPANAPRIGADNTSHNKNKETGRVKRRYHKAIWAAFQKKLELQNRRYLKIRSPFRFEDTNLTDMGSNPNYIEIKREEIASESESKDKRLVEEKITSWLTRNGLSTEQFAMRADAIEEKNSFLAQLLNALSPQDLQRIEMPLDIVNKLLKHKK